MIQIHMKYYILYGTFFIIYKNIIFITKLCNKKVSYIDIYITINNQYSIKMELSFVKINFTLLFITSSSQYAIF